MRRSIGLAARVARLPAARLRSLATKAAASSAQHEQARFPGAATEFTRELKFAKMHPPVKTFRRMDTLGNFVDPSYKMKLDKETLQKMYQTMVTLNAMDTVFYDAQRQGRISFYMTNYGEEATHIGSAAALTPEDHIFGQYREAGVLMWRGYTLQQFANQLYGNEADLGKGRQMPVHYGSRALNFQTISSPLATQIPQAAGAAYALKREGKKAITMCYFGDGAASEGDFHVAMNMSATLECPVVFFCRNNGYAISTPTKEQYRGDGIVGRASGYGMTHLRVDGNDLLAVHEATTEARKLAIAGPEPVLIEAMTYRGGHHSTSDDATRYRKAEETQYWRDNDNPITRTRLLMERLGWWDSEKETQLRQQARKDVLVALENAEKLRKPPATQMFADVYAEVPPHLQEQQRLMLEHVAKYPEEYQMDEFAPAESYKEPAL